MLFLFELLGIIVGLGLIASVITIFFIFMRHIKQKEQAVVAFYEEQRGTLR